MRSAQRLWRLNRWVALCLAIGYVSSALAQPAAAAATTPWIKVYPDIVINGQRKDVLLPFLSRDGRLYADAAALAGLGLRLSEAERDSLIWQTPEASAELPAPEPVFALDSLPQSTARYNGAQQRVDLQVPLSWLDLPNTALKVGSASRPVNWAEPAWGLVLNYDASVTEASGGTRSLGVMSEWRGVTPYGFVSNTHLMRTLRSSGADAALSGSHSVRLDTYWQRSWPQQSMTLTVGDTLTSQIALGGGTRIGGLRLQNNFSLQPGRVTVPLASYAGSATLPSTVDLLINGVKQSSYQVPPGQFDLTLPPSLSGAGMAQMVVTDMLGRKVTVNMSLYGSSQLLAKGLNDWSIEAGWIRRDYGVRSWGYSNALGLSGTWRRGVTNWLTAEGHVEAARAYVQGAAGFRMVAGNLGEVSASASSGRLHGVGGRQASVTWARQQQNWGVSLGHSRSSGVASSLGLAAEPLANIPLTPQTMRNSTASLSLGYPGLGSWNLFYIDSRASSSATRSMGVNWSRSFSSGVSMSVGWSRQSSSTGNPQTVFASVSFPLGSSISASAGASYSAERSQLLASAHKPSSVDAPVGWNVGVQQTRAKDSGTSTAALLSLQYGNAYGLGNATLQVNGSQRYLNANWSGSLVWLDGWFASRQVADSFAVVSSDGVPGVPIYVSNGLAGKTDSRGLLLATNLASYQRNKVGIDTLNLPASVMAERTEIEATPADHSGTRIAFKLRQLRPVTLSLRDSQGEWLSAGSEIVDAQGKTQALVGLDGKVYLENAGTSAQTYQVRYGERNEKFCRFSIEVVPPASVSGMSQLPPQNCE